MMMEDDNEGGRSSQNGNGSGSGSGRRGGTKRPEVGGLRSRKCRHNGPFFSFFFVVVIVSAVADAGDYRAPCAPCCFLSGLGTVGTVVRRGGVGRGFARVRRAAKEGDRVGTNDECPIDAGNAGKCLVDTGFYRKEISPSIKVNEVYVAELESLRDRHESYEPSAVGGDVDEGCTFNSNRIEFQRRKSHRGFHPASGTGGSSSLLFSTHSANIKYNELVSEEEVVLVDVVRKPGSSPSSVSRAFHRAGPRTHLHFDPTEVNAAICIAGGLCPGLNNVVRELVHTLYYQYNANRVWGIMGGFFGFYDSETYPPVLLTNELVAEIHHEGGTVLRSSRGGFNADNIMDFLIGYDVSQLYVIGGDGTHRGAYEIHKACVRRNLNVAVAGIPKTIDNDLDYIDRSFGFQTAVEVAQAGIRAAVTEAKCNVPNGIGIIKLMGRHAGFLSAFAALGSGEVDLVLVPEVPIVLEGKDGILPFLRKRIKEQKYAVVVVAEGVGEELLGVSDRVDAGGNRERPKIGEFITEAVSDYFASFDEATTVKYIDPSYMVRSVPANGADSLYCMELAQNAVHGAMAGYSGFSTGLVNKHQVYIPIPLLCATSPRSMDPYSTIWERIIAMTGQPNTAPPRTKDEEDSAIPNLSEPIAH